MSYTLTITIVIWLLQRISGWLT